MISLGKIKSGETFAFSAAMKDHACGLIVGKAAQLKSQVRGPLGVLLGEMTISESAVLGTYDLVYDGSTANWPSTVVLDIKYSDGHTVVITDTFELSVDRSVTV